MVMDEIQKEIGAILMSTPDNWTAHNHLAALARGIARLEHQLETACEEKYEQGQRYAALKKTHDNLMRRHAAALERLDALCSLILPAVRIEVSQ